MDSTQLEDGGCTEGGVPSNGREPKRRRGSAKTSSDGMCGLCGLKPPEGGKKGPWCSFCNDDVDCAAKQVAALPAEKKRFSELRKGPLPAFRQFMQEFTSKVGAAKELHGARRGRFDFAQFFKVTSTRSLLSDFAEMDRMNKLQYRDWMAKKQNGGLSERDADRDFEEQLMTLPPHFVDKKGGMPRIAVNTRDVIRLGHETAEENRLELSQRPISNPDAGALRNMRASLGHGLEKFSSGQHIGNTLGLGIDDLALAADREQPFARSVGSGAQEPDVKAMMAAALGPASQTEEDYYDQPKVSKKRKAFNPATHCLNMRVRHTNQLEKIRDNLLKGVQDADSIYRDLQDKDFSDYKFFLPLLRLRQVARRSLSLSVQRISSSFLNPVICHCHNKCNQNSPCWHLCLFLQLVDWFQSFGCVSWKTRL